ncbi:cache domain-containing sensor histidine kinase [Paenibacillus pinistramenti]|uniref:cache domain-containing sensor histidine kinase n=1 Tax=Paenibacillus pinistramenti TaxID=1768003 RepID=UPI003B839BE2
MKQSTSRFSPQTLFGKIFVVMVVSTISVALVTSLLMVQVSQKLFMNTFSITNTKIIQQIKNSFEDFNYDIVTVSGEVAQSLTVKTFLTEGDKDSLSNNFSVYRMTDQMEHILSSLDINEVGVAIIGVNGRSYFNNRAYWTGTTGELKGSTLYEETIQHPEKLSYHYFKGDEETSDQPLIIASKALRNPSTKEIYGILFMMIREKDFRQFYGNFTSTGNDVVILNHNGQIVSSNLAGRIGQTSKELLQSAENIRTQNLDYMTVSTSGASEIVLADYLQTYDYYIVNLIDKKMALEKLFPAKQIILTGAAIVTVSLMVIFIIVRRVTRSLRILVRQMSSVTKRNLHNYITIGGSYETRELGTAFNYMLDELNDYISQLVETQREQRNAELAALQRQINPHFLYNTLASVNILVQRGNKEKATETIRALISLLQNTISNVSETITVEQELINLKHYVFINQVRYGPGIQVDYFVSPDCMKAQLPKLILQPFIENSFFHGFMDRTTGYIYVMIAREGGTLVCEVVDNGTGMDLEAAGSRLSNPANKRQMFTGIGVRNVHERILLLYGEHYGVTIESKPGEGTKVRLRIPWLISSEDEA